MSIVEMRVHMDCPGCESKIKKALQKLNGVDEVDIDMQMQKVTVTGWADRKRVLKTVRKTGRMAELWPFPYNPEYHNFTRFYYQQHNHHHHRDQSQPLEPTNHYVSEVPSSSYYMSEVPYSSYYRSEVPYSSYNYRVHGYNGHDHGYFHQPPHSTILNDKAISMFSDDNTSACSIM